MALSKLIVKQDGDWSISRISQQTYENDSLVQDFTLPDAGSINFKDDGTGSIIIDIFGSTDPSPITWSYNDDNEQMTIVNPDATTILYNVLTNEKDNQVWDGISLYTEFDSLAGVNVNYRDEIILELTR